MASKGGGRYPDDTYIAGALGQARALAVLLLGAVAPWSTRAVAVSITSIARRAVSAVLTNVFTSFAALLRSLGYAGALPVAR